MTKPLPLEWQDPSKVFNRLQSLNSASQKSLTTLKESFNAKRRMNWIKHLQADNKTEKELPVY